MSKHEWRKAEKNYYLPKNKPEFIEIPEFKFVTISGEGNPNDPKFSEYIGVLYSVSYAIKMGLKKLDVKPVGYLDYTVYPLEGVWDLNEEAKKIPGKEFDKDDLVFNLMIRQPDFITNSIFEEILALTRKKKPHDLLDKVKFENFEDGRCIQMLHLGSYDTESASFKLMEEFAKNEKYKRISKNHREIYLSDFRKVPAETLKTVLRFWVKQV